MSLRTSLAALFVAILCGAAHAAPVVPKPNPVIPTGAWANLLKAHPRLYGSKDYLQALAKEHSSLARGGNGTALGAGIAHVVQGLSEGETDKTIQEAMKHVNAGVTNEHQDTLMALQEVAVVFDLLHDRIKAEDRKKMIEWFNGHLGRFTTDENAFHNSTLSKILCYLQVAYATSGDNPRAKEFRDYAVRLYEGKIVPILRELGAGGGFTECGWYTRGSLWNLVQGLEMARRFEKYDGFALAPQFFYQRMAYELHQSYPGTWKSGTERYPVEGDGANTYSIATEYPRFTRNVLAQYFRGSDLAGHVAAKNRSGSNELAKLYDGLYQGPADAPKPLDNVPLAHFAEGIGKVYARSDWGNDATWFRFECGPFFTNHQHLEVGNFEIFRHEPLATESGEYKDYDDAHAVNWLSRTVAHNSILVYNPAEQFPRMRHSGAKVANDGGQHYPFGNVADNLNEWKARRQQFIRGQIAAYENRPEWLYIAADCTPAYSPNKLSLFVRQVVYLRPGTFVIFDRVVSKRADFPKMWLLHCQNEPLIEGTNTSIRNGEGALAVMTLLPQTPKITAVKGYTYPAFNGKESFPAPKSSQTDGAHLWRMEVAPSKPAAEDLFLHVLSTTGAPQAKLSQEGGKITVTVDSVQVIFSGKAGGEIVSGSKRIALPQKIVKGAWE